MGKETGSDDEFSILLGSGRPTEEKTKRGKAAENDVAKPEKKVKAEAPHVKPEKKWTTDELITKRDELELFLASLEEAHSQSKIPEYSYDKLKKKCEFEMGAIEKKIGNRGYNHVKKDEGTLEKNLSDIRKAVSSLKNEKMIDTEYNQKGRGENVRFEEIETKLNELFRSLNQVSKKLGRKIEELAVTDDVEITENVKMLKREIEGIRSSLSEFVRMSELQDILLRPGIGLHKNPKGTPASEALVKKNEKIVGIKDISGFVGKNAVVRCSISLFQNIDDGKQKIYWYRIEDRSGSTILTSYEKIDAEKAKILGDVRKTRSGSYYMFFKKLV